MDKYIRKYMSVADALAADDLVTPVTITVWEGDEHQQLSHCTGERDVPCEIKGDTIGGLYIVEKGSTGSTAISGWTGSTGFLGEPLHFVAVEDYTVIYCDNKDGRYMEYSTDGVTWKNYASQVSVSLNTGDVVWFKGYYRDPESNNYAQFYSGRPVICAGEVNSMVYGDRAWTGLDIPRGSFMWLFSGCPILTAPIMSSKVYDQHACYYMFQGCSQLKWTPDMSHITYAGRQAFDHMFNGCSSLQQVSKLNESIYIGDRTCQNMFSGCTSLTSVPSSLLPATTLANQCYYSMFYGCTNLTNAPDLPAPTLVDNCYRDMFNGCSKLNSIKCLATNISASGCVANWVNNVAATGTFYKDSSMTSWPTSISGIPSGWTVEDV